MKTIFLLLAVVFSFNADAFKFDEKLRNATKDFGLETKIADVKKNLTDMGSEISTWSRDIKQAAKKYTKAALKAMWTENANELLNVRNALKDLEKMSNLDSEQKEWKEQLKLVENKLNTKDELLQKMQQEKNFFYK